MQKKVCRADIIGRIPGHQPAEPYSSDEAVYVGLFRDPRRRLLSAFNYGRHWFVLFSFLCRFRSLQVGAGSVPNFSFILLLNHLSSVGCPVKIKQFMKSTRTLEEFVSGRFSVKLIKGNRAGRLDALSVGVPCRAGRPPPRPTYTLFVVMSLYADTTQEPLHSPA